MNAIYMPEDPRYRAIREALLGSITDVIEARKRNDLMGQIQGFMDVITGKNNQAAPSILEMGRAMPSMMPGAAPTPDTSGYQNGAGSILETMRGNPPAAPDVMPTPDFSGWPNQESQTGNILDALSKISDPGLFTHMLPTALDYDYKTRAKEDPVVKMEFSRQNKDGGTSKRTFNVRMSQQDAKIAELAKQGWEPGEIIPPKMTLKENKRTKTYWAIPEDGKGQPVDTGIPYDKEGPETWTQWKDPKSGVEYNISSRGKKELVSGQEKPPSQTDAASKISAIDKAINSLKTKGALDDPIMAVLAAQSPELVKELKGDPTEAIKTLEAEREYLLKFAPPEVKARYEKKPGSPEPGKGGGAATHVYDPKLKKIVPVKK